MARKPTGAVISHEGKNGETYRSLRFSAYGKRRFMSLGPIDEDAAERKLRIVLDQVAEGIWQPPQAVEPPHEPEPVPTFHQFAEQWWVLNRDRWAPRTVEDYKWRLEREGGLISYFGQMPLDRIDYSTVQAFIAEKLAEKDPLSPRSINMQLVLLAAILDDALERGLVSTNAAKGKRRRVRERAPQRAYLDSADAIGAVLSAAATLDARARERGREVHVPRRAIVTTLLFTGLRVGELCALCWGDVDLGGGWLHVGRSKTDAGVRRIKLRGIVRDVLVAIKPTDADPAALVFATATGGSPNPSNVRNRILTPAVELANEALAASGGMALPHLTPHGCRRTFASLLYAIGEPPRRHERARPHEPGAGACDLRPVDEPKRGREPAPGRARRRRRIGSQWQLGRFH